MCIELNQTINHNKVSKWYPHIGIEQPLKKKTHLKKKNYLISLGEHNTTGFLMSELYFS